MNYPEASYGVSNVMPDLIPVEYGIFDRHPV
jgi:hypothetical protein